jgi:hypothetical protein
MVLPPSLCSLIFNKLDFILQPIALPPKLGRNFWRDSMCLSLGSLFGARHFARLHISGMSFSYCPSEVIKRRTPIYPMPPMFSRFISCNADRLSNLLPTAIDHYIFGLNSFWNFVFAQEKAEERK